MARLIAITSLGVCTLLATGCDETDACAAAAAHVNSCYGTDVMSAQASCDPVLAEELLAIPCDDLALGADRDKGSVLCQGASERCLALDINHPGYWLDEVNEVAIGGRFVPLLDKAWYQKKAALAAQYGVDPYYWIAFSLEEYGGYRLGADHTASSPDRALAHIAVGRKFVKENGAAGILVGDVIKTELLFEPAVQQQLRQAGLPLQDANHVSSKGGSAYFCEEPSAICTQDKLDRQSFVVLKRFQDKALADAERVYWWEDDTREGQEGRRRLRYRARSASEPNSIGYGMQGVHGYGNLPYLYRAGDYGADAHVRYNASSQTLSPSVQGITGVAGSKHPIYGMTILHYIAIFAADARFGEVIPATAATPITTQVLASVATGVGIYGGKPVQPAPSDGP